MPQGGLVPGMHLQMKIAYDSKNRGRSGIRSKGDVIFVQPDFHRNNYNPDQRYEDHQPNQHYEDQLDYPPFPHDYPPYHHGFWNNYIQPVNNQVNQPTHPSQNRQIYTQNFVRLNSRSNISTNQNQAPENSENNDISLLIQSHAKITALIFDRENPKS